MVFDPETQQLKCPYCGALKPFSVERVTPYEYDIHYSPPEEDAAWNDDTRVSYCGDCGAELVLTGETKIVECPFCGSENMLLADDKAGIAPDSLIPFQITRTQAQDKFRQWLKGKVFAPAAARKRVNAEHITGVYLPQWVYTDSAVSEYQGKAGRHRIVHVPVTVTGPDGRQQEEKRRRQNTKWEAVSGEISQFFEDVDIAASTHLPEELTGSIRPFRMSRITRYSPEYIAGFACEKPTVNVQEGWQTGQRIVDQRMAVLAEKHILTDADEANVTRVSTVHEDIRYKLVLMPLYLTAYRFKKKTYRVLVNGQTGKTTGQVPISALRIVLAVVMILALLGGLFWLFMIRGGSEYMFYDFSK